MELRGTECLWGEGEALMKKKTAKQDDLIRNLTLKENITLYKKSTTQNRGKILTHLCYQH